MKQLGLASLIVAVAALVGLGSPDPAAADFDCADFATQAEAQEYLEPGDPYGLDADNDGIACESNPCPCGSASGGGGGGAIGSPPPPPPFELSKSAARAEARHLARRFVRRNPNVDSLAFGGCHRLAMRRIDCSLIARGATPTQQTRCGLQVAVRAKNHRPTGQLHARCQTVQTLRLTAASARGALRQRGAELAEKPVVVLELERLSALAFRGYAEWTRASRPGQKEECAAQMKAMRATPEKVAVTVLDWSCDPIP